MSIKADKILQDSCKITSFFMQCLHVQLNIRAMQYGLELCNYHNNYATHDKNYATNRLGKNGGKAIQ